MQEEKGNDFEKLFMEAVDEGLNLLGESGKQMVFFHLERSYLIKRQDIPKKPEAFAKGLEKIFSAGAIVIEKLILENLCSKLGLKYEEKEHYTFVDYLKEVQEKQQMLLSDPSKSQLSREKPSSTAQPTVQRSTIDTPGLGPFNCRTFYGN
jgi:hypothetical protein